VPKGMLQVDVRPNLERIIYLMRDALQIDEIYMTEIMYDRKRMIEVPVNYFNRSEAMNARYRNRKTFLRILSMIAGKRLFRKW
jgi:hypothetical protein